jgi:hypothetical protein
LAWKLKAVGRTVIPIEFSLIYLLSNYHVQELSYMLGSDSEEMDKDQAQSLTGKLSINKEIEPSKFNFYRAQGLHNLGK